MQRQEHSLADALVQSSASQRRMAKIWAIAIAACICMGVAAGYTWFLGARSRSATEKCAINLRILAGCKDQWALEHHANTNASPTWDDLIDYVKSENQFVRCPQGGTYTIGRIGELPSCSVAEHTAYFRQHH
jgi:hypothetical protein